MKVRVTLVKIFTGASAESDFDAWRKAAAQVEAEVVSIWAGMDGGSQFIAIVYTI